MNSQRSIFSICIDFMVDNAAWVTPFLVVFSTAFIAFLLYRKYCDGLNSDTVTSIRRWFTANRSNPLSNLSSPPARLATISQAELKPFTSPLTVHSIPTPTGQVQIIHCAWSRACPDGSVLALNQVMRELLEFASLNNVWRVVVDIPSFGPSSRYFFHCLRDLGHACANSPSPLKGVLLIRFAPHPPGYSWFTAEPDTSFYQMPDTHSLDECFQFIANAEPLSPPTAVWD